MTPKITVDLDFLPEPQQARVWKHLMDFALQMKLDKFRFAYSDERLLNLFRGFEAKLTKWRPSRSKHVFEPGVFYKDESVFEGNFNKASAKIIAKIYQKELYSRRSLYIFSRKKKAELSTSEVVPWWPRFYFYSANYLNEVEEFLKCRGIKYNIARPIRKYKGYYKITDANRVIEPPKVEFLFEFGHGKERGALWRTLMHLALQMKLNKFKVRYFEAKFLDKRIWRFKTRVVKHERSLDVLEGKFNKSSLEVILSKANWAWIDIIIFSSRSNFVFSIHDSSGPLVSCASEHDAQVLFKFLEKRCISYTLGVRRGLYVLANKNSVMESSPMTTVLFGLERGLKRIWGCLLEFSLGQELDTFKLTYYCGSKVYQKLDTELAAFEIKGKDPLPRENKNGYCYSFEGHFNRDSAKIFGKIDPGKLKEEVSRLYSADIFSKKNGMVVSIGYGGDMAVYFHTESYLKALEAFLKTKGIKYRIAQLYRGVYKVTQM